MPRMIVFLRSNPVPITADVPDVERTIAQIVDVLRAAPGGARQMILLEGGRLLLDATDVVAMAPTGGGEQ